MASYKWFLLLVAGMVAQLGYGQGCVPSRYLHSTFEVDTVLDVVYGTAPAIPVVYIAENVTVPYDLKLDLYLPAGDTLSRRPVILFAFGGGFLIGSKEDEDVRSLCDSFARKGYVAAAINYRLGLNTAIGSSAERAVWRGVQDWSAAIRYLKEHHDTYRLDTNMFFAGGASAGSFAAMHCQYASDSQRPASTYAAGFPFPAPDLGCKDCEGNSYSHLSSVRALINCWGAIGDTLWIDAQDSVPMLSFHGNLDAIVPYGYGYPFTALLTLPEVYGSSLIHARARTVGLPHRMNIYYNEGHNIWGTIVGNVFAPSPTEYWVPILDSIRLYLWYHLKPVSGEISGAASVWEQDVRTYSVPMQAGYRWCWRVTGGTILSPNASGNSVEVRWDQAGVRVVEAIPVSHLDAVGDASTMLVQVLPSMVGNAEAEEELVEVRVASVSGGVAVRLLGKPRGEVEVGVYDLAGRQQGWWVANGGGAGELVFCSGVLAEGMYVIRVKSRKGKKVIKYCHH